MARARAAVLAATFVLAGAPAVHADDARIAAAITAALPADGRTDVILIDLPAVTGAPRVRAATRVNASPAAVRTVLLDPTRYRAMIPSLIRSDARLDASKTPIARAELGSAQRSPSREGAGTLPGFPDRIVEWELEVPIFNLSGRFALRALPDGARFDLFDGDFAPGHLLFRIAPGPGGSSILSVDASMDVRRSSWLLRRILSHSPFGPPAALAAAADVALRAVALRAEHPGDRDAWRPSLPPGAPATWQPDARALLAPAFAALRANGVVAMVARHPNERLAGVVASITIDRPPAALEAALQDPRSWRAFPGWRTVEPVPGTGGPGGRVEDNLPLLDLDATYAAVGPTRWAAVEGATRGARLGWTVAPEGDRRAVAALSLYPRLEATGSVARRFIAAEPLLESGLALALSFADIASLRAALAPTH